MIRSYGMSGTPTKEQESGPFKMYCWSNRYSFLAVAHARSVAQARELLLLEIGDSGDGSCPERDKARRQVLEEAPEIWMGPNAEFTLSDSAELQEQILLTQTLEARLHEATQPVLAREVGFDLEATA